MPIIMKIILTYRRTSRLSMRIGKDGSLRVSAPYGYPTKKIDSFIESHREWIAQAQARHEQRVEQENDFYAALPLNTPAEKKAAKQRLQHIIEPMLQHYSQAMQVKVNKLSFRASKSRWGSCRKKTASINFSLYLLLLPEWCIEHVVVHARVGPFARSQPWRRILSPDGSILSSMERSPTPQPFIAKTSFLLNIQRYESCSQSLQSLFVGLLHS